MSKYSVGNIFGFSCTKCEYNRHCYGGDLGNQYKFCQKSKEKLESFDKLQQENKKYKEVIDKVINDIDLVIELIKQQPTEDDNWILGRLNAFKIILKEEE